MLNALMKILYHAKSTIWAASLLATLQISSSFDMEHLMSMENNFFSVSALIISVIFQMCEERFTRRNTTTCPFKSIRKSKKAVTFESHERKNAY